MTEVNRARTVLFNQLLKVQHRNYGPAVRDLRQAMEADPDFIARACCYLATGHTAIRDQVDSAIISLLQADPQFPEFREAGRCLLLGSDVYPTIEPDTLPGLDPFRVIRILDYIQSRWVVRMGNEEQARFSTEARAKREIPALVYRHNNRKDAKGPKVTPEQFSVVYDDHPMIPRLAESIVHDWLRALEADPVRFDGVVLHNRRKLKQLYISYHIPFDARANQILYQNKPPADSRLAVLKQIANSKDIREQAKLAEEAKIPYRVLASVLPDTPAAKVVLIGAMTPTEALNARQWVENSGMLAVPEVKEAYLAKIAKATKSVASAEHRKSAQGSNAEVQAVVEQAKEKAVKETKRIERPTLLMVDKSGSMEQAIATAIELGARIAPLCDSLLVTAFDENAREVAVRGTSLADWQAAFRSIRSGGQTNMGACLRLAERNGFVPDQIVVVTDEGENGQPYFADVYQRMGLSANVVVVTLPNGGSFYEAFTRRLHDAGIPFDRFTTDGNDYFVYDQVVSVLTGAPALTLADQILATELPHRKGK